MRNSTLTTRTTPVTQTAATRKPQNHISHPSRPRPIRQPRILPSRFQLWKKDLNSHSSSSKLRWIRRHRHRLAQSNGDDFKVSLSILSTTIPSRTASLLSMVHLLYPTPVSALVILYRLVYGYCYWCSPGCWSFDQVCEETQVDGPGCTTFIKDMSSSALEVAKLKEPMSEMSLESEVK